MPLMASATMMTRTVFRGLVDRGLQGPAVQLVVSDDHKGLRNAIERHFQEYQWQRCQVHYLRNLLSSAPKKLSKILADQLRDIFNDPDRNIAHERVKKMVCL